MSEKNIVFDDKNVSKSSFYKTKNYLIYMTSRLMKY